MQAAESAPPTAAGAAPPAFFDCNICLDAASSPVVTLCGHLYWCARPFLRAGPLGI